MSAIRTIRKILNIQAGTLIKGLYISHNGSVFFSTNKWYFEQKKYIKGLWTTEERESVAFEYIKNSRVSSLIKSDCVVLFFRDDINFPTFRRNGSYLFKDAYKRTKQEMISSEECLGMSLGESIIAVRPFFYDTYRPDFYEIYLFHKILRKDDIVWVVLRSKSIGKNLVIHNPNDLFLDVEMKLV